MFGYNAQFKRCAIDGAKTLRVQRLSATTGVKILQEYKKIGSAITSEKFLKQI